jgi:hypothetical protein
MLFPPPAASSDSRHNTLAESAAIDTPASLSRTWRTVDPFQSKKRTLANKNHPYPHLPLRSKRGIVAFHFLSSLCSRNQARNRKSDVALDTPNWTMTQQTNME